MLPISQSNTSQNRKRDSCPDNIDLGISKDGEWVDKAPRVGLLITYGTEKKKKHSQGDQPNCRFWRRHTEMPLCICAKDRTLRLPPHNPLLPNGNHSYCIIKISFFKKRDKEKNFLWAPRLWVGRRWEPILGYISKFDGIQRFKALMG